MSLLKKLFFQLALFVALRRPMPSRYSLEVTSPKSQHFVGVAIEDETKPMLRFVVQERYFGHLNRFRGRYYVSGMTESAEACTSLLWLAKPKLRITRIYGPLQLNYDSVYKFIFHVITFRHVFIFRRQRRDQRTFDESFRFSAELADTLKKVVRWQEELAKQKGEMKWDWSFYHMDALNALYPPEIWGHGENNFFILRFKFTLDALVANGDLKFNKDKKDSYEVSPRALQTLSAIEVEQSRHRDSAKLTKWLVVLTGVIAFFAFIEAFQH